MEELGITEPPEIDLEAIAFHVGATVTYRKLDGCAARIGTGNQAIISVNPDPSVGRRRFSIGHELGHWMRDRGFAMHQCQQKDLNAPWGRSDSESLANAYAADLLLPHPMFKPRAQGREITFTTVKSLANEFRTSLAATAIRLVQLGSYPSVVICHGREGRLWFSPSPGLQGQVWPTRELHHETQAFDVLFGGTTSTLPRQVSAGLWFSQRKAPLSSVYEHSVKVDPETVLTLLWWKDPSQLTGLVA